MAVHVGVRGPGHISRVFGWTPAQLGSSLLGWWDAEDSATITQSGGLVSSWKDKVAAYDAVQALGSAKPVYSATSFNSRPGLTFDGVDDEVTLGSQPFPSGATPSELWALVDQTALVADVTGRFIASYGGTGTTNRRRISRSVVTGVNRANVGAGDGGTEVSSVNSSVDFSGRHVVRGVIRATEVQVDVNGTASATAAVVPATTALRFRIGANSSTTAGGFWQGVIPLVIITGALDSGQAAQLLAYLKARGGIA